MKTAMTQRRMGGFSMVELMVSVVVGMIAVMFATRLLATSEQEKSASLGGSDTMQNGMLAMFSLNYDAAQAGWGLNDVLVNGCNAMMKDSNGYELQKIKIDGVESTPLTAVTIVNNGERSDVISLNTGAGMAGVGNVTLADIYNGGTDVRVTTRSPYGFNEGDVLVVVNEPAGGNCSVAQLAGVDEDVISIAAGNGMRFNSDAGLEGGIYNQTSKARVFNLGPANKFALHTWSVDKGVLRLRASNLAGSEGAGGSTVIDNVVAIKAQYGFDTRNNFDPQASSQVSEWSADMVDADNSGTTGDAGDYQRVVALRLAVIARSPVPEKPDPTTKKCTATTKDIKVFETASPATVAAVPVTVKLDISGDTVDWTCYRYRAFENVVQIRNNSWRP